MLEVFLLIAAVVIGIAVVMRMDTTPREPRVTAPAAPEASASPERAARAVVDVTDAAAVDELSAADDIDTRVVSSEEIDARPATGSVAA